MLDFIFKDRMRSEFDIDIVTTKQGRKQRAEEYIDVYEIPYRNGEVIIHSGKYKSYIQEFEFVLRNPSLIPEINAWLYGRGKLILDNDYETFGATGFYYASVIEGWEYERNHSTFHFSVKFKVDPFYYFDYGQQKKTYTSFPIGFYNSSNVYWQPYIRINGHGNVALMINDKVFSFTNIDGYIEIDSELMIVYKDTINQGEKMSGDFPVFLPKTMSNISWSGNVTSIELKSKARTLG